MRIGAKPPAFNCGLSAGVGGAASGASPGDGKCAGNRPEKAGKVWKIAFQHLYLSHHQGARFGAIAGVSSTALHDGFS
jgi:hypothetical protein